MRSAIGTMEAPTQHTRTCTHAHKCTEMHAMHMHTHKGTYMHTHVHMCILIHAHKCVQCTYTGAHAHTCSHVHTYMHTNACNTYAHTYTYTCTHVHTQKENSEMCMRRGDLGSPRRPPEPSRPHRPGRPARPCPAIQCPEPPQAAGPHGHFCECVWCESVSGAWAQLILYTGPWENVGCGAGPQSTGLSLCAPPISEGPSLSGTSHLRRVWLHELLTVFVSPHLCCLPEGQPGRWQSPFTRKEPKLFTLDLEPR